MIEGGELSGLAAGVLAGEVRRATEAGAGQGGSRLPDDELPGVDEESMPLRKGIALGGGAFTFLVLLLVNSLDELETAAMSVLAPTSARRSG
jgi:hypothetical protein